MASISGITVAVVCIEIEQEKFIEFGCYLYRASLAIMELLTAESSPANAIQILQTLSKSVDLAKDVMKRCQEGTEPISDNELRSIIAQLEEVIKHMGDCLSLIPSSSFGDQKYAEVAIRSLSNEMRNAKFGISQTLAKTYKLDTYEVSLEKQLKEQELPTEKDLYPVSVEVSADNPQFLNMPSMMEACKSTSSEIARKHGKMRSSSTKLPQVDQYIEPLYETFFCPLTQKIMDDPVTIETGVTYERKAITEWFEKFKNSGKIICPTTGKKLVSTNLNTNIALKCTIEEWRERNESASIKVAKAALSLASSESMVLEAIKDLQSICQRKQYNRIEVLSVGILPLLLKFIEYKDRDVRCAALELLRLLAEEDDDCKVLALYLFPEFHLEKRLKNNTVLWNLSLMLRYTYVFQNYENKNDNLRGDSVVSLSYRQRRPIKELSSVTDIQYFLGSIVIFFGPLSTIINQSLAITSNSYNQNLPKQALTFTLLVLALCYFYVILYVLAYKYMRLLKNDLRRASKTISLRDMLHWWLFCAGNNFQNNGYFNSNQDAVK